jgi:hypothetical protein
LLSAKAGKEDSPTPEMLDKFIEGNLTRYRKTWIGVTAHEIGHLLGASEVRIDRKQQMQPHF